MDIAASSRGPRDANRLLCASVVPRPVAWVSTIDAAGRANLAPFSYFNAVTSDPPIVMISVGRTRSRPGDGRKDTAQNLLATGEAVVHIAPRRLARAMVTTSADVPPGTDEFDLAGLARVASTDVRPPRVAAAPIAMECILERHLPVGNGPSDVFFLRVVRFHVDDAILRDGLPDAALLDAIGRLGGEEYCASDAVFRVPRPGT
jgi:flavin reductase (DIM6/NTAB) family NADH-FMN oxidoreductase RutF